MTGTDRFGPCMEEAKRLARRPRILLSDLLYLAKHLVGIHGFRKTTAFSGLSLATAEVIYAHPNRISIQLKTVVARWPDACGSPSDAAVWITDFASIHPFSDGNGRLARTLAAAGLIKHHFSDTHVWTWLQLLYGDDSAKSAMVRALRRARDFGDFSTMRELAEDAWRRSSNVVALDHLH